MPAALKRISSGLGLTIRPRQALEAAAYLSPGNGPQSCLQLLCGDMVSRLVGLAVLLPHVQVGRLPAAVCRHCPESLAHALQMLPGLQHSAQAAIVCVCGFKQQAEVPACLVMCSAPCQAALLLGGYAAADCVSWQFSLVSLSWTLMRHALCWPVPGAPAEDQAGPPGYMVHNNLNNRCSAVCIARLAHSWVAAAAGIRQHLCDEPAYTARHDILSTACNPSAPARTPAMHCLHTTQAASEAMSHLAYTAQSRYCRCHREKKSRAQGTPVRAGG